MSTPYKRKRINGCRITVRTVKSTLTGRTYYGVGRLKAGKWTLLRERHHIQLIYPEKARAFDCARWIRANPR